MSKEKDYGLTLTSALKAFPTLLKSRVEVLIMWPWCATIAVMVAGKGYPPIIPALTAVAATFFIAASVYIYNDLIDAEMDSISSVHKNRPIASGKISETAAWPTIILTGLLGLALSYVISTYTFLLALLWFTLFMIYTLPQIRLKKRFLLKELTIACAWPLVSVMGSFAVSGGVSIQALFSGVLFGSFLFLVLPSMADSFDEYEDGVYGVKTLARSLSWGQKVQMFAIALLLIMTITPLTYARLGFNIILPIVAVGLGLLVLRFGLYPIRSQFELQATLRSRKIVYMYFFVVQLIVVVSVMTMV